MTRLDTMIAGRPFGLLGPIALGGALALAAGSPSRAGQEGAATPPAAPPSAASAARAALDDYYDVLKDLEQQEPPDGKWLIHEDGREYFITRLKKVPGTVRRHSDPHKITYKYFYDLYLDHEDDGYYYIRYFRGEDPALHRERTEKMARDREAYVAEMEELHRVELGTVDRLEFTAFDEGLPREGQWRQGFEVVDMNGDGVRDIVHGPARKGSQVPVVFLGDRQGKWRVWREVSWPRAPYDYGDVAVADIDGDGRLDIGLGVHLRGLLVVAQTAPGRFEVRSEGLYMDVPGQGGDAGGFSSKAVSFADWNGDGRPDLVALGEGPRQMRTVRGETQGLAPVSSYGLLVFLNEKDGTWRPLSRGQESGVYGDDVDLADFDGDGRIDAATVTFEESRKDILHLNRDVEQGFEQVRVEPMLEYAYVLGVAAADFDEDGRPDLATSFSSRRAGISRRGIQLLRNRAEGWEGRIVASYETRDSYLPVAAGDVDGDGHADVVSVTQSGRVLVLLGDGAGGFLAEESPEIDSPLQCQGYGLEVVDVDGDGRGEIVASFAAEVSEIHRYLGGTTCATSGALRVWRSSPRLAPAGAGLTGRAVSP